MFKTFETEYTGRKLVVETGKMAQLANGSALVRFGDTVVIVNVTASKKPREGVDFFPLSVDYEEKLYSVGKIPGSFQKREGKPADKAILTSRVIDRPIRPLFPKDLRNDVAVVATVLSVDQDNSPEVAAMLGSSIALSISDIPFNGPTGSVMVGYVDGQIVLNPNEEQRNRSRLQLTVSGTKEKVCMIEAGADEIPEDIMLEAICKAHEEIKKVVAFIESIQKEIGKPKFEYEKFEINMDMYHDIEEYLGPRLRETIITTAKQERESGMDAIKEEIIEHFAEKYPDSALALGEALYYLQKKTVRKMILEENIRPDGRKLDQIRPLSAEIDLLPRVHGSALFSRGQTQVLSVVTLGQGKEEQILDGIDTEESKRYIHHYNFPPYSVGEAKAPRSPGRREIGHGALAERALAPVIPSQDEFPYTIRVVSEVLASNGSTSQGSVCGSTLALMAAGVPIKEPVAGISCGLITDEKDPSKYLLITDIQGIEDFFGDMDFKVAGTKNGITAIQVDIKVTGLSMEIIRETFERLKQARTYILDEVILKTIDKPRAEVSKYAPKTIVMNIDPEKIRDVIGQGGKVINKIIEQTGVQIDIEDDGKVCIYATDTEKANEALKIINGIVKEPEVGEVYMGRVTKIMNFGAFVEILPGKEGLVHISKLAHERVNKVEDVVKEGDEFLVKVIEITDQGKINLSRKDLLPKPGAEENK
ncbi:MAG: polyribonucleotide nucleotidyltransferase [Clostridia bacterium]|nr:polyribonucleotide nucleotidyltransferase [Clostridia bacterium]